MPPFTPNAFLTCRTSGLGWWSFYFLLLLAAGVAPAADQRPVVGPGATKEDVLEAYGWPTGQTQAGAKEILTYPQGRVVLENGRVEAVDFSVKQPWPAPRPRPGAAGSPNGGDSWFTSWPEALREAQRRQVRILTLFTGSDWSPPSRQFVTEVAESTEFLTAFLGSFVLLKLDYPTRTTQAKELRAQNAELRERFAVTTYPSVVVVETDGALAGRVDLNQLRPGNSYRTQVVATVREARDQLPPRAKSNTEMTAETRPAETVRAGAAEAGAPRTASPVAAPAGTAAVGSATSASLSSASWALTWGLSGGSLLVVVLLWLFWRNRPAVSGEAGTAAERVADAASGVPSSVAVAEWSHARLRAVVGALAETDGYDVRTRAGGAEGDLALVRAGEDHISAIVTCAAAGVGSVSAKRLRELFGTITVEEVGTGWFVAMGGFSAEAREYAQAHGLALIGKDGLREQLRALTERDLARIMAQGKQETFAVSSRLRKYTGGPGCLSG